MKLNYANNGRQFFFVTMVSAGRRPVFSRLLEENRRPELTRLGELLRAALRAVHHIWPSVAISDYVVMPDHVHFLLIVDYGQCRSTSPLYISHRVADAVEMAVARGLERTGAAAPAPLPTDALVVEMASLLPEAIQAAGVASAVGLLHVGKGLCFGNLVEGVGVADGLAICPGLAPAGGAGARAPVRSIVFARDCYIELSFDSRQLKAIRQYIRLNPARALWKLRHPDLFVCHRSIRAHRLQPFLPLVFDGIGALPLLGSPFLFHVRLTLRKTVAEHAAAIDEIVEKARHGMVPVSGFISPGEKEALRRLKAEPKARFVKLLPHLLPPRYDPSSEDSREISAGRLLILSCFRDIAPISAFEMKRNHAAAHVFRRNCLAMNDIAARLCEL